MPAPRDWPSNANVVGFCQLEAEKGALHCQTVSHNAPVALGCNTVQHRTQLFESLCAFLHTLAA